MKITDNAKNYAPNRFEELHTGDVFYIPSVDCYYMKVDVCSKYCNAIILRNGCSADMTSQQPCVLVEAELIVNPLIRN